MRVVLVGLGNQGKKRQRVAGDDLVATVDPFQGDATYRHIEQVPLQIFDAALVCTPDKDKVATLKYLLSNNKHVLVEKPLITANEAELNELRDIASERRIACYTAYNHRFEPHIARMNRLIRDGILGDIYSARFYYGNGSAKDVKNSPWRDTGMGVLADLGSHLLDLVAFFWGQREDKFEKWSFNRFENRALDHVIFGASQTPVVELEATLLSWRNSFRVDVYGETGSAHIDCLCKWGPSCFTSRKRILPSGKPDEETLIIEHTDLTWEHEYRHFMELCQSGINYLDKDIWINRILYSMVEAE